MFLGRISKLEISVKFPRFLLVISILEFPSLEVDAESPNTLRKNKNELVPGMFQSVMAKAVTAPCEKLAKSIPGNFLKLWGVSAWRITGEREGNEAR